MPTANPILRYSPAGAEFPTVTPATVVTPTTVDEEEATSPSPIITYPSGGASVVLPVEDITGAGTTPLVIGQSYIDVAFGTIQTDAEWVFLECVVVNTTDADPLNIWPGIITIKTAYGFRLQLNGMPDSSNYYLHWAISGTNITPGPASTYLLSGPSSGGLGVATSFTVSLPPSTTISDSLTVIPDDGGAGGTFSPTSVVLTTTSASQIFTYTPASYGAKTISTTNSGTLTNPASITFNVFSATYTLSGPSSGTISVPSTNFTVALPVGGVVSGTVTVTPSSGGGGGTFTPTTVNLTTGAPSATFTYTPASNGTKTISVTNNGGLTNPGTISYVVSTPFVPTDIAGLKLWLKADAFAGPPADGTAVSTWVDSSGNGNDGNQVVAGSQPLFKTNRINGLPAVKFDGVDDFLSFGTMIGAITTNASVFIVQRKNANSATLVLLSASGGSPSPPTNSFAIYLPYSDNNVYFDLGDTTGTGRISSAWGGNYTDFFAWSFVAGGGNMAVYRNGTTVVSSGGHTNSFNPAGLILLLDGIFPGVQDADIAEILIYNAALGTTDRQNVEAYLANKYAL